MRGRFGEQASEDVSSRELASKALSSRDLFFEGSEKKIEISLHSGGSSLRELGQGFWSQISTRANADILSSISNEHCDAYVLSESSLFVWDDKFLMLTCGTSVLVDAALLFIEKLGVDRIAFVSYQRKSEYFSHLQGSSFSDDIKRLRAVLPGDAVRVGHLDAHHHYLYTSHSETAIETKNSVSELLMYHIQGPAAEYLRSAEQSISRIRDLLKLNELFPGFIFDDFLFKPFGYSINGLCGERYMTIHITPQESSSYVSLETDLDLTQSNGLLLSRLLNIFNPGCWDIIAFNSAPNTQGFPAHICIGSCTMTTSHGDKVSFTHFQQDQHEVLHPERL